MARCFAPKATLRALDGASATGAPQPMRFDAAMLRADCDLIALLEPAKHAGTRALSFCFHGPPGTRKRAFARRLAETLELDVIEERASEFLSKWIGDTEKAIRASFEEAADRGGFLIFDEADSLLAAREDAQRSWEVTQVNEMLVCMERHPLPFACTTNAFQSLDRASLRRFLFKIGFLAMSRAEVAVAFANAFGASAPESALALDNLTPGDFAVVARKADLFEERRADEAARWLAEKSAAKPDRRRRIGF